MRPFLTPENYWSDTRALKQAREGALAFARVEMQRRRAAGKIEKQSLLDVHSGQNHVAFFRDQFPQLIAKLPSNFRAIEIGAGMGWQAALLAANSNGTVTATEITYNDKTPFHIDNVFTLHRLSEKAPELVNVLNIKSSDAGTPVSVEFDHRLGFARSDAAHLPFASGSADLVYSNNCIEHLNDLSGAFAEASRVLRLGGLLFGATEPLYFSAMGHHLSDFFPIPWGHLLWTADELAEVVLREGEPGREWKPGETFGIDHVRYILGDILNYATPRDIRKVLASGSWRVEKWLDLANPNDEQLAREIHLFQALKGIDRDALLLTGLRFHLRKADRLPKWQTPLRLDFLTRRNIRSCILFKSRNIPA